MSRRTSPEQSCPPTTSAASDGEMVNRLYFQRACGPKTLWEIPGAGHVNGIATRGADYERHVIGFFDRSL